MDRQSFVHENVLEQLLDGVMAVGMDSRVRTFNPAAARILGLDRNNVVGNTLAEAFISKEGFEDFVQAILDAVMAHSRTERRSVEVDLGDRRRVLSMTTSYLTSGSDDKPMGVIAVFSDITEMQALQEAERRMAGELEKQNAELKKSYRMVEESQARLASMLKKVQVARVAATIVVIALFLGAGVWNWSGLASHEPPHAADPGAQDAEAEVEPLRTLKAAPEEFTSTTLLIGRLAPWRRVPVTSPADGHIAAVLFAYGRQVSQGEPLIRLNMENARLELLEARVEHEAARKAVAELDDWESSVEVAGALRAFSKARMAMEGQSAAFERSSFLLKEGLIPASQHEGARRSYESQRLDLEAARQDLEAVRAKGGEDARRVAEFNLEKAYRKLSAVEAVLSTDVVKAPISGVIREPAAPLGTLAEGREVKKGDSLVTIADFDRMDVLAAVDEVEVASIRVGQQVTVWGVAYPGLELRGKVSSVSSEPRGPSAGAPRFQVRVRLDDLGDGQRKRLRAGMSAHLRIVTYRNPSALMLPIEAVQRGAEGKSRVRVLDEANGEVRERAVRIGLTTLNAVEVTGGLSPGELVVVSGG